MQNLSTANRVQPLFEQGLIYPKHKNSLLVEIKQGMAILTEDGRDLGRVKGVVLDGDNRNVTHLLLAPRFQMSDHDLAPVKFTEQVNKETLSFYNDSESSGRLPQRQGERSLVVKPLTSREFEVLLLIEAGLSNREIAAELIISTGTAKKHISNIYGKLGVSRRTQAIALARNLKIL